MLSAAKLDSMRTLPFLFKDTQMAKFEIIKKYFNGLEIIFRHWDDDRIEVKVTDEFAKANGYSNIQDWLNEEPEMRKQMLRIGLNKLPEWALVTDSGEFVVLNNEKLN